MRVDFNAFIDQGLIVLVEKCQQALCLHPEQLMHVDLVFVVTVLLDDDPEFPIDRVTTIGCLLFLLGQLNDNLMIVPCEGHAPE